MDNFNILRKKVFLFIIPIVLMLPSMSWTQKVVDISQTILKIQQPVMIYDFGNNGFGLYDIGDSKMKIFNWDFKLYNQFSLPKGEGPGEIKGIVLSAFLVDKQIYILGLFEKKIIVFNNQGELKKEIPLEFSTKELLFRNNNLYGFNFSINVFEDSFMLGAILNHKNGKKLKDITVKNKLLTKKILDGNPMMIGMSSTIDVTEKEEIFLLISSANVLAVYNRDGTLLSKVNLPYKERKVMQKVKENDEEQMVLSVLDWYTDMRAFEDSAYICFLKTKKKDKDNKKHYQTVIMKVKGNKEFKEKIMGGNFIIIGKQKNQLQLFNIEEYKIIGLKLSEWD